MPGLKFEEQKNLYELESKVAEAQIFCEHLKKIVQNFALSSAKGETFGEEDLQCFLFLREKSASLMDFLRRCVKDEGEIG